jgi:CRP-like cAMP-binding protein
MGDSDVGPQLRLLAELSADEAAQVAELLTTRRLTSGQALFRQGDPSSSAFMLVEGQVEILVESRGAEHSLAVLGAGAVLGESSLLLHSPHMATAVARSDTTLWEITRDVLRAGIDHGDSWAAKVLLTVGRELARRVHAVDEQLLGVITEANQGSRVAELETLRHRLLTDWSF